MTDKVKNTRLINTDDMPDLGDPLLWSISAAPFTTQTKDVAPPQLELGFSGTGRLPFNVGNFTFRDDKGNPLFVAGLSAGIELGTGYSIMEDDKFPSLSAKIPVELRAPVLFNSNSLFVAYTSMKAANKLSLKAPEGASEGSNPELDFAYDYSLTLGAAYYRANDKHIISNPFLDMKWTYNPKGFVDGIEEFSEVVSGDTNLPKTEFAATVRPPASLFKNFAAVSFTYQETSAKREIDGVGGYKDHDHSLTGKGAINLFRGAKFEVEAARTWTENQGDPIYHIGADNGYGNTSSIKFSLKAAQFWKMYTNKNGEIPTIDGDAEENVDKQGVSLDQAMAEDQSILGRKVPITFGVKGIQTVGTHYNGPFIVDDSGNPVLDANNNPISQGSDTGSLVNTGYQKEETSKHSIELGAKFVFPVGFGELTVEGKAPINISKENSGGKFIDRINNDPTEGPARTVSVTYEAPLGAFVKASQESNVQSAVDNAYDQVSQGLVHTFGLTDAEAVEVWNEKIKPYMLANELNSTTFFEQVFDEFHKTFAKEYGYTFKDFLWILDWCNKNNKTVEDAKDFAKDFKNYAIAHNMDVTTLGQYFEQNNKDNKFRKFDQFVKAVKWCNQNNLDLSDVEASALTAGQTVGDFADGLEVK